MPRLHTEDPPLNPRSPLRWTVAAAAGAALVSFAGLLGRWCADPALGWAVALAAAGLGCAAASRAEAADEEAARAWAAGGAIAALCVPALLRVIGLSTAEASLLQNPLGGAVPAAFALGQAALLAAAAAGCWSRAARGTGARGAAAALAGGAAAALAVRVAEPTLFLSAAALCVLAAAVLLERPWARRASAPLRSRAFGAAAAAGLGLAVVAPNLLCDVWMTRLHSAYPGGAYLALGDDGAHLWAAYRFSNGTATMLRDGVPQTPDPRSVRLAVDVLLGQREGGTHLLLSRPPEAVIALFAQADGAIVTIDDGSAAEKTVLDALGGGPSWRGKLVAPAAPVPLNAALIFPPTPPSGARVPLPGPRGFRALAARLSADAVVGILLPPGAAARDVETAASQAAAVFGSARVADLPRGTLVAASRTPLLDDPARLEEHLRAALAEPVPGALAEGVLWRPAPSAK